MLMRYRLAELAEQDLLETWLYVAADTSVERADQLLEAIGQRFDLLANDDDGNGPAGQILLVPNVLVGGQEDLKPRLLGHGQ